VAAGTGTPRRNLGLRLLNRISIPFLAVLTGLILGGLLIMLTTPAVYEAFNQSLGAGLAEAWNSVSRAYLALFEGAFGSPARIAAALQSGSSTALWQSLNPFLETLTTAVPYILAGLAVALGFRAGVFNIGAEGQIFIGALTSGFIGYAVTGLPALLHIPLALAAGFLGGAAWGAIPGWLKARTGAHEVITTIMMNYIAFRLSDWLLSGPMKRPGEAPISPPMLESAILPRFFPEPIRFHLGFFIALGIAYLVYWLLFKTTWGFSLRTVGANPRAARYAGMSVARTVVLAMALSGGIAGLAGANEVLGVNHNVAMAFSSGYGFDSIALALLGNNHPFGVVLSALLFGGATNMQVATGIPNDIVSILQALILIFIAAPSIIRGLYRLRTSAEGETLFSAAGWGRK
jgi:simple sugar transport system permease protein